MEYEPSAGGQVGQPLGEHLPRGRSRRPGLRSRGRAEGVDDARASDGVDDECTPSLDKGDVVSKETCLFADPVDKIGD